MSALAPIINFHNRFFAGLERVTDGGLLGLLGRVVFALVLLIYFWNSAWGKIGDGPLGFLTMTDGAYFSILGEGVMTAYEYDKANVPLHLDAVVYFGTWMEFLLPLLIIIGLFTRLASIGMIGFVIVQSVVDIVAHGVDATTIGAWFDNQSGGVILDQRALWIFLFIVLIVKGGGWLSLDRLFSKRRAEL